MKNTRLKTGDILMIPLPDETFVIGQIVLLDLRRGAPMNPLLQVLRKRYTSGTTVEIEKIDLKDHLLPPVITGVGGAVKNGYWKKIGHRSVENFSYPSFISTIWSQETGEAGNWYLRNAMGTYLIGKSLSSEYKHLEFDVVLDPHDVTERIMTGKISFPFGEMIQNNRFDPMD